MATKTSITDIDLNPIPGKRYLSFTREWREEFIYSLLVDRFHDDRSRTPVKQSQRSLGVQAPNDFYGGKISEITRNLDYIAGLGCAAIWLSPIFENNPNAYHGYNINNYLNLGTHFGTKQDLIDLVEAAHNFQKDGQSFPIKIILDVVINHSGDNWEYAGGPKQYSDNTRYDFGAWRRDDRPISKELRETERCHDPKGDGVAVRDRTTADHMWQAVQAGGVGHALSRPFHENRSLAVRIVTGSE